MIDHYSFGQITIDGKAYTSDVIIYPDHVNPSWWRKEGHNLQIEDLTEVITAKPDTLIIGTGASGVMDVSEKVKQAIAQKGIKLIVEKTGEACKIYNKLKSSGKVIAALHLTC
ncbi:MAG: hypothetical protein KKB81_05390 [Candidatus Margulisbacteria bacterium]|nr:hypothetical protein [Candidatus Margulisiibacteriota bacterium]MBU1021306.1 hypothetical protein [Candidatus Margulisiibacteriota bacterium]MBU1729205.1 hypothetical protein [Candidatus Margulisiibacteriota bacterium]MBU1954878.1 hypothetical protein [Candidatus Margulisiibacteriota bacterium]